MHFGLLLGVVHQALRHAAPAPNILCNKLVAAQAHWALYHNVVMWRDNKVVHDGGLLAKHLVGLAAKQLTPFIKLLERQGAE